MDSKKNVCDRLEDPFLCSGRQSFGEEFHNQIWIKDASRPFSVGRNLKALRVQTDLTARELAEVSGVSHTLIRSVENGHRSLLIGPAILFAKATGVDVSSLMFGDALLEWGGAATFTANSYREWVERGRKPSPRQQENVNLQLRNLCNYACDHLGVDYLSSKMLTVYLRFLIGGVDHEIQYAGVEK